MCYFDPPVPSHLQKTPKQTKKYPPAKNTLQLSVRTILSKCHVIKMLKLYILDVEKRKEKTTNIPY